jgi:hypothetical protein
MAASKVAAQQGKPQQVGAGSRPGGQGAGMSKLKKIEWYAGQLITDAVAKEKSGSTEEAIVNYLNAADLLLLLAKGQENYSIWKSYSDRAIQCQQRAKTLMAARKE